MTGSSCRHRLVTVEHSAGLNTGAMLAVVSSHGHCLGKISNRAGGNGGEQYVALVVAVADAFTWSRDGGAWLTCW